MKKYAYYAEDAEDLDEYEAEDFYLEEAEYEDIRIPWTTLIQLAMRLYVIHKQVGLKNLVRLAGTYYPRYTHLPPSLAARRALALAARDTGVPRKRASAGSLGLSRYGIRQYLRRQQQRPRKRFHSRAYWR